MSASGHVFPLPAAFLIVKFLETYKQKKKSDKNNLISCDVLTHKRNPVVA